MISHQDPSSDLPFSMDCLVRISKISIRVAVFRARNNRNFTSHSASTSMRFKTNLSLNGTIQFMIESFMLYLWILDYGWFALIHPSLPFPSPFNEEKIRSPCCGGRLHAERSIATGRLGTRSGPLAMIAMAIPKCQQHGWFLTFLTGI